MVIEVNTSFPKNLFYSSTRIDWVIFLTGELHLSKKEYLAGTRLTTYLHFRELRLNNLHDVSCLGQASPVLASNVYFKVTPHIYL